MGVILLPVKDPRRAKQRLGGLLSREERYQLAWAMLADVGAAIRKARCVSDVFVITSSPNVYDFARCEGWDVLIEQDQLSESASVDWASSELKRQGIRAALRLPGDVPLVQSQDIDTLFEVGVAENTSVIVPSRDGTGTNALLRIPPDAFPSRFGPDSYRFHQEEARKRQVTLKSLQNSRIAVDLDEGDDLLAFLEHDSSGHTRDFLSSLEIRARLQDAPV